MKKNRSALISIRPQYVDMILNGSKTIELRRKPLNIKSGTRIWIYSTLPDGNIRATASVKNVYEDSKARIWELFRDRVGITKQRFYEYFHGNEFAYAMELEKPCSLEDPIHLDELRFEVSNFHPPQSYMWLSDCHPLSVKLKSAAGNLAFY